MDFIGKPGPFKVIRSVPGPGNGHESLPRRRYECSHYQCCLSLAAAMNWDSFTCRGCNGVINEALLWRARAESRKDHVVKKICELPDAACIEGLTAVAPSMQLIEGQLIEGQLIEGQAIDAEEETETLPAREG